MDEIWRSIPGYERIYEISNFGRIRSLPRDIVCKGKISGQIHHQRGQFLKKNSIGAVGLYKNGQNKFISVNKLLKMIFPDIKVTNMNEVGDNMNSVTNEIWKPVEGFEGYYEVSNTGKVRSLPRTVVLEGKRAGQVRHYEGKELKNMLSADHVIVKLYKEGQVNSITVGRLVALHFLPGFKESGASCVAYKDGNPENCNVENLTYKGDTNE